MSSSSPQPDPTLAQISTRVIQIRRALINGTRGTVSARQKASTRDPGVKGPIWVSRVTYSPPPENELQRIIQDGVYDLGSGHDKVDVPEVGGLEAQWIGWRSGVDKNEPEAPESELERYEGLMREIRNDITILYVYGGAFMVNGPHSCRSICSTLARLTGGRCYTVRYRLAPQHPFPAALLDILHAYLTLISPPPGSFHERISPSSIVFAGDSAGACLAVSAVQTLLSFARSRPLVLTPTILFHGRHTQLPLPSGLALVSPGFDQAMGVPTWWSNAATDIFSDQLPAITDSQLPCALWPSNPPRGHPYTEPLTLLHPLVSPCTAESWEKFPPMWIAMGGGERLLDAAKLVARDAVRDGCIVRWTEWEKMPHLWMLTCKDWWQATKTVVLWAEACTELVGKGDGLKTEACLIGVDGSKTEIDIRKITSLKRDEIMSGMRKRVEAMKVWTGKKADKGIAKSQL